MKKLFLAVSSMIVTGFLLKSYKKLHEQPGTEEEVYEDHLKIERRRAAARTTFAKMDAISTQRDGGLLSSIDVVQQMAPRRFA